MSEVVDQIERLHGRVVITKHGRPALVILDSKDLESLEEAIVLIYGPLARTPQREGRALRYQIEGLHSARRGDYRIIHRVDEASQKVIVEAIGHRSDIYPPRD